MTDTAQQHPCHADRQGPCVAVCCPLPRDAKPRLCSAVHLARWNRVVGSSGPDPERPDSHTRVQIGVRSHDGEWGYAVVLDRELAANPGAYAKACNMIVRCIDRAIAST